MSGLFKRPGRCARWMGLTMLLASLAMPALGAPDLRIHPVQLPNRLSYWPDAGFVDMVGPMRLPTDKSIKDHIAVWVRVPKDGIIKVTWLPDQKRYTLLFPPGTVADRVESERNAKQAMLTVNGISDVRGARIGADGRTWFHDYEPVPGESGRWLKGYEWLRAGPVEDNLAADRLIKLFYPGAPARARDEMAEFRRLNQCGACHRINRPTPAHMPGAMSTHAAHILDTVDRPSSMSTRAAIPGATRPHAVVPMTDADGFFQPITVMTDTMVVRNHRRWDLNADDPYITVKCGDQKTTAITHGDARYYVCANGDVPTGTLDMTAALKHKDPHALKVCKARTYLYAHMDAVGKKAFKRFYEECRGRS